MGAQSIARLCQNLIIGGISEPTEDAESCGFFNSKDLRRENDLKY